MHRTFEGVATSFKHSPKLVRALELETLRYRDSFSDANFDSVGNGSDFVQPLGNTRGSYSVLVFANRVPLCCLHIGSARLERSVLHQVEERPGAGSGVLLFSGGRPDAHADGSKLVLLLLLLARFL